MTLLRRAPDHPAEARLCVSCGAWPAPWQTKDGRMCSDCHRASE